MFICSQTGRLTASQSRIHSCKTRHTGLQIKKEYFYKASENSHYWFPREKMSEKGAQKFHTDNMSLPRSG